MTRTLNDANPDTYDENFINNSVETLCKIITDAAADTFGTFVPKRNKYQNSNNKPWFIEIVKKLDKNIANLNASIEEIKIQKLDKI